MLYEEKTSTTANEYVTVKVTEDAKTQKTSREDFEEVLSAALKVDPRGLSGKHKN